MITVKKKSLRTGKYVGNEHVDSVIRTYKKERWAQNSEKIGKEDSLSAWYSLEQLEEFIAVSKSHGANGIKCYFGAYPEDYTEIPEFAGRQTVVLVATKEKETLKGTVNKDIYVRDGDKPQILAIDGFKLCPPVCMFSVENQLAITIVDRGAKGLSML